MTKVIHVDDEVYDEILAQVDEGETVADVVRRLVLGSDEDEDRSCQAVFVTVGPDPSSAECVLDWDHKGKHRGLSPLGGSGVVEWYGGHSIAGDREPYREVEYVFEEVPMA